MSDYQVIKLSNGENLICDVISDSDTTLNVKSPLKMETLSKFTKSGVVESLSLVRWMQPYCDDEQFALSKNNIILNSPVSIPNWPLTDYLFMCIIIFDVYED